MVFSLYWDEHDGLSISRISNVKIDGSTSRESGAGLLSGEVSRNRDVHVDNASTAV